MSHLHNSNSGCYYDINTRPSGGVALIPCSDGPCYSEVDRIEELKKWLPYQKVLARIVKRKTSMNVDQKIKQDGKLADLAPTILDLMNIEKPEEMTGESLLEKE